MPKRTSNSSVNSSIRQQTKSNEEGLGNLLETQKASLGELSSIRQLLELSKEHQKNQQVATGNADAVKMQAEILNQLKEQTSSSKRHYKKFEDEWKELMMVSDKEASQLAELAKSMDTTGNIFQEMGKSMKEKVKGGKEFVQEGGIKRGMMSALNVGGIFNKQIAKHDWTKQQEAMGYKPSKEDAEGAYQANKQMKSATADLEKFKKKTGITDDEGIRATPAGAKLLDARISAGEQMTKFDKGAQRFDKTVKGEVTPEKAKTPTQSAADAMQAQEVQMEGAKDQHAMAELLHKIEENTRPGGKGKDGPKPEKAPEAKGLGDSLMETITGFLGDGLMNSIKTLFSPGRILKFLGKAFAIGAIIGALWEGISDGFDEFMKTGDIGKALIAGLAGIVDFLTFGLFDKEKIKEVIGDMAAWVNDHIVKPVTEFFSSVKDGFMNLLGKIKIPAITIPLPKILGGDKTIGPWSPFGDGDNKKPEAVSPTQATQVEQKSANNAAAAIPDSAGGNKTNVVNAPTVNQTTQNQIIRAPIRNQESSVGRYTQSRYAT